MCGIFAYNGDKKNAASIILEGLKRLDYRGYDSWGVAVCGNDAIAVQKQIGKIENIATLHLPDSFVGIGHTRWATTGAVTQVNAHPHYATDKSFVVAQNGIVENFEELKATLLEKGYKFISQTDTEVIVRLIEDELLKEKDLRNAVRNAFLKLTGRNTIILMAKNGDIIAARNGSPLVVGINEETGEKFISSDTLSFAPYATAMIVMENGQMVTLGKDIAIYDIKSNKKLPTKQEKITIQSSTVSKEGYEHYMLKEIHETPHTLRRLLYHTENEYKKLAKAVQKAKHVYTIGSGTAGIAAAQIAFYLRNIAGINATALVGADAREYYNLFGKDDLIIAPSQSGETADVLEVLEFAKEKGVKIASLVNMPGSLMTRMSDYKFYSHAGPEICVMSTKVFTSQIAWGYLLAKTIAHGFQEGSRSLEQVAQEIDKYLADESVEKTIIKLAERLIGSDHIFLLGKYQNFQIVKEGMVKIIEGSYKHAHAIPAGDLKHYAITLIEKDIPVVFALSQDKVKDDVMNAVHEVKLRGAYVVAISPENHEAFDYWLPVKDSEEASAIMNVIPLQLLAYFMAKMLGNNIDKPRNIAKSVTVK